MQLAFVVYVFCSKTKRSKAYSHNLQELCSVAIYGNFLNSLKIATLGNFVNLPILAIFGSF